MQLQTALLSGRLEHHCSIQTRFIELMLFFFNHPLRQVSFVSQMKKSSPDVIAEAELTLSEKNHIADAYQKTV